MIRGRINPRTMYAMPSSGGTTQLEQNTVDEDNEDPNVMGAIVRKEALIMQRVYDGSNC